MPNQFTKNPQSIKDRLDARSESNEHGCRIWTGHVSPTTGYGVMKVEGKLRDVHRLSWKEAHGDIPDGLLVCHSCDIFYGPTDWTNRRCINPEHLWLGTRTDNQKDMAQKGRAAIGDRNGSRVHPERRSRGEKHSQAQKGKMRSGDSHGLRMNPDRIARGEKGSAAKLTEEEAKTILSIYRRDTVSQYELAARFGVTQSAISALIRGKNWKHLYRPTE